MPSDRVQRLVERHQANSHIADSVGYDELGVELDLTPADKIYSGQVIQLLRRAFTPKGLPFFQFYADLKRYELGLPIPDDIQQVFKKVSSRLLRINSPVDKRTLSPNVVNQIASARPTINSLLGRLRNSPDNHLLYRKLNEELVPLIAEVAKDKGVYLRVKQVGNIQWASFWKMSGKQEQIERLKDDDPETYALIMDKKMALEQIDAGIADRIERTGQLHRKIILMGRPVNVAIDSVTGEERVYDRDGEVLTKDEFVEKRRNQEQAKKRAYKVPDRTVVPLSQLRTLPDEEIDALPGPISYASITDDKAKQGRLTRLFAVKKKPQGWISRPDGTMERDHVKVIASGRFKGVYLDDMVNSQGRMIEGTAYDYSPKRGRATTVPEKIDPSNREPYVTMAEVVTEKRFRGKTVRQKQEKLFLKIGGGHAFKELRRAMQKLSCNHEASGVRGCVPSIIWQPVQGSRAAGFYFEPKDFAFIMETLQGMSLSKGALDFVKDYYEDLSRAEQATDAKNLGNYSADALGGFVAAKKNRDTGEMVPFDLNSAQKRALAWMDANGNSGVCALETGVGKSLTSLGMAQKLIRDGLADPGATYTRPDGVDIETNGRFLYVVPKKLKGNIPKEIRNFVSDPGPLLDRVDTISYREFSGSSRSGKVPRSIGRVPFWVSRGKGKAAATTKQKQWDPALYAAIFFDEGQMMRKPDSAAAKAALSLYHPRKIILTASPMEKEPMDAYVLAAITNNLPLVGKTLEARQNRKEMRRFKERFCETIGGRIVGVKDDPAARRDLQTWVKRNLFHTDKNQVSTRPEDRLPDLRTETVAVEMDEDLETVYKEAVKPFTTVMQGLVSKFRDKGRGKDRVIRDPETGEEIRRIPTYRNDARMPEVERVFSRAFQPLVQLLTNLSNNPTKAFNDIATMVEEGNLPNGKPIPNTPEMKALRKFLKKISKMMGGPEGLRQKAKEKAASNPKVEQAIDVIKAKLEQTEGKARTLLFSDDVNFCMLSGEILSSRLPGKHVVALGDRIFVFRNGTQLDAIEYRIPPDILAKLVKKPEAQQQILMETGGIISHKLPLREVSYRLYPMPMPAHPRLNTHYKASEWNSWAFKEIFNPDPGYRTATLFGPSYQYGHNLQAFDTVVHLDRDSWNSENMKQRTARAWRQGQENPVDEITIDMTYNESDNGGELDKTLDEIRRFVQTMEGELFDRIIKDSQGIELGKEWLEMQKSNASTLRLDTKVLELMMSPYVERSQIPGA